MICLMAQRPSARAEPGSGDFKGGHYKEFGAQIAPFVALARHGACQRHPSELTIHANAKPEKNDVITPKLLPNISAFEIGYFDIGHVK